MQEKEFVIKTGVHQRKTTYIEWGNPSNSKVLLCVHGLTRTAHDFDYLADFIQNDFRVIAVNLAGHGSSDYLADYHNYNYRLFMEDVLALLDHLNLPSVYWIGSSLGGIVGLYASQKKILKKLILNDIAPQMPERSMASLQNVDLNILRPMYTFDSYALCRAQCMKLLTGFKFPTAAHLDNAVKYGCISTANGKYALNFDVGLFNLFKNTDNVMRKEGIWPIWEAIDVPILEMWGALSPLVTKEIITRMKNTNKNLTVCKCLHNGHVCNLIDQEQLDFVLKWLNADNKLDDVVLDC